MYVRSHTPQILEHYHVLFIVLGGKGVQYPSNVSSNVILLMLLFLLFRSFICLFIVFLHENSRQYCTVDMPEIIPVSCVSLSGEMHELHADGHSDGETAWRIQRPGALFLLGRTQVLHPLATI